MINEAVWKSPKWMKRFADFEVRSGKDILPEDTPSKEDIDLSKEMKSYLKRKWNSIEPNELQAFLKRYTSKNGISLPSGTDYGDSFVYDLNFWSEYDEWKESTKRFLADLNTRIIEEVSKIKTKRVFSETYYYFETGYGYISLDEKTNTIKGRIRYKDETFYDEEYYNIIRSTLKFLKERGGSDLSSLEREHNLIKNKYNAEIATSARLKKQYDELKSKFEDLEKVNAKKVLPERKKPDITFQQKIDRIKNRVKEVDKEVDKEVSKKEEKSFDVSEKGVPKKYTESQIKNKIKYLEDKYPTGEVTLGKSIGDLREIIVKIGYKKMLTGLYIEPSTANYFGINVDK